MKERHRVRLLSAINSLITMAWLLMAAPFLCEASPSQIPKNDINEVATIIVAGESPEKINGVWAALVEKYPTADFSKAIDNIIRQSKSL